MHCVHCVPGTVIISHWGVGVSDQLDNLDQCQDDSAGVSCEILQATHCNEVSHSPHSHSVYKTVMQQYPAVMQTKQISRANLRF